LKKLITEIISLIETPMHSQAENVYLVNIENFDSPIIYMELCKYFSAKKDVELIANLEYNKYKYFVEKGKSEWTFALEYLKDNGYVQSLPLTKFRNIAAEKGGSKTLLLLMGAETALDRGSLKDFNHISMNDIVVRLKKDYSLWFKDYIEEIGSDFDKCKDTINNIYKDLFRHINVDAVQLSNFIDGLANQDIASFDELVSYIYGSLNEYWDIPSIRSNFKKPSKKTQKYISNSYNFINNSLNLSSSKKKSLAKKLDGYAEKHDLEKGTAFEGFSDYDAFGEHLIEFVDNKNINENRKLFMDADFGVVTEILDLSLKVDDPPEPKDKVIKLTGEPLTVYLEMILHSWIQFREKYHAYPLNTEITVTSIRLSNCTTSDSEEESSSISYHFENICTYMGGLLEYIKEKGLKCCDTSVDYTDGIDPFNSENTDYIKPKIKSIDKWGENSEIKFTVCNIGESEDETKKTEFKWSFSPYASWKNAFSLLRLLYNNEDANISPEAPLLTTCSNMDDLIASESEDEFFIKLESIQCEVVSSYTNAVCSTFRTTCIDGFSLLRKSFEEWTNQVTTGGFFNCIDSMNTLISNYTDLLNKITADYKEYPSNIKSKIGYILNIFNIISDSDFLDSAKSSEVIIPAYNPAMLEKIIARNDFIIYSFAELMNDIDSLEQKKINNAFNEYGKLAAITQGVDVIPCGNEKLICKNVWGYYALYYGEKKKSYINNIELVPEECDNNADISEQSDIIYHHIWNYIKTFPSRIDGLNVAFISPTEIQYVVEGINKVSDGLTNRKINATINIKVICFGGSKNIGGYLKYWLNNYMSKDKTVTIKTYLQYISADKCDNELNELLDNQDLCFIYDILKTDDVQFDSYIVSDKDARNYQLDCQFPMTFIPDTIAQTHSCQRKVNISQVQFFASKSYTQLANRVMNPHTIDGEYKVMQVLELQKRQNTILEIAHNKCRWVVCEDKAIDRELLQADSRRIIGFTTGEGCFGEYNVTVSASADLLDDIKSMLKQRLIGKFSNWSIKRAENAANYCIQLTESFDGSRILKALNPYDYEIHNFLAYALTVKKLGIDKSCDEKYITRSLINLDSYQHWFRKTGTRPDFMLIEIPINDDLYIPNKPLDISIKIIECKMSVNIDAHLNKAVEQLTTGLNVFSKCWTPDNISINRRYWFTQLYRAIAFSVLSIADNDPHYAIINSKIYNILNGDFHINWSGDVYAFDLKSDETNIEDIPIDVDMDCSATIHRIGQIDIQRMLIPTDDGESLAYIDIEQEDYYDEEYDESDTDYSASTVEIEGSLSINIELNETALENEKTTNNEEHNEALQVDFSIDNESSQINEIKTEECTDEKSEESTDSSFKEKNISDVRILLGSDIRTGKAYYWEFGNKNLNNRHLLINGNSGCGKTYCMQGLLMSTAMQGISSVVFDYTGGFTEDKLDPIFLKQMGERVEQRVVYVEGIPINPFKKGTVRVGGKDYPEKDVSVASRIAEIFTNVYKFGPQQKSAVYSAVVNGLRKNGEHMTFSDMADELETAKADTVISKIRPFIDLDPFVQGENFEWEHIRDNNDGIVYVIQLDGYDRGVQVLLTELLLWDIWNFSVKTGDENKPFILVMDEAQNLSHGEKSPSAKILTEGRKFGLSGWYATQFMKPQLSDDEIQRLQQAGQKLYFCPPDDGVETVAKSIDITSQGKKEWAERLKKLKKGECVTCGNMVINNRWTKYDSKQIKVPSLQERLENE
jgi:hypothetical protein